MGYIGRFAPSPTGPLHFGSLIAALASYLDAKAHDGKWLVRIEDIDETRCDPIYTADILRTLQAFEMKWDGDVKIQSKRKSLYDAALQKLRSSRLIYACACSRKEIADSALAGLKGPVYPGTCRHSVNTEQGHALRIRTSNNSVTFMDHVQGYREQRIESDIGDFVVRRRDGLFAYQFAVTVDDADQGVTHVVRGADLLDSTARQIHLQRSLGYPTPEYLHIPVAVNAHGQKLSKQTLATAVSNAEDQRRGVLLSALLFLGQSIAATENARTMVELIATATQEWRRGIIPHMRSKAMDPD